MPYLTWARQGLIELTAGAGTTTVAAIQADRNSIANEIDPDYFVMAEKRVKRAAPYGLGLGELTESDPWWSDLPDGLVGTML